MLASYNFFDISSSSSRLLLKIKMLSVNWRLHRCFPVIPISFLSKSSFLKKISLTAERRNLDKIVCLWFFVLWCLESLSYSFSKLDLLCFRSPNKWLVPLACNFSLIYRINSCLVIMIYLKYWTISNQLLFGQYTDIKSILDEYKIL